MRRAVLTILALALVGPIGFHFVSQLNSLRLAGIGFQTLSAKRAECERAPRSRCFAELAVMQLPAYSRFSAFNTVGRDLRFLGFGDIVDKRLDAAHGAHAAKNREAARLLRLYKRDPQAFAASPPASDPFVYNTLSFRIDPDYTGYGGGNTAEIRVAEEAALARRGRAGPSAQSIALLSKWRESLELHGERGLDWLFYVSHARKFGSADTARYALEQAVGRDVHPNSHWDVVFETWQLRGLAQALAAVAAVPETNRRARLYLILGARLMDRGQEEEARHAYRLFEASYDEEAAFDSPLAPRDRAWGAALLSYRLFGTEAARPWVERYRAGYSFAARFVTALHTAELYADVGAWEHAAQEAYLAIGHAPAPGQTARGPWLSRVDTTGYHNEFTGRAIGVLCEAGRAAEAFARIAAEPAYGPHALQGCRTVLDDEPPTMTLDRLAQKLKLRSRRELQQARAAERVEAGNYDLASELIRSSLNEPPARTNQSRAAGNLAYLRLAIAMRDEPLTRRIMSRIAADGEVWDGDAAVRLYASVAIMTRHWPGD